VSDTSNASENKPNVSLLWPPGLDDFTCKEIGQWGEHSAIDLGIGKIVNVLNLQSRHVSQMQNILSALCYNPSVIFYRQNVLDDFLNCPGLAEEMEKLLDLLRQFERALFRIQKASSNFQEIAGELSKMEMYTECIQKLKSVFTQAGPALHSEGLLLLRDIVTKIEAGEIFQVLVQELPELRAKMQGLISSITIGVNLDHDYRPVEATLLSINTRSFQGDENSFFGRLLNLQKKKSEYQGIGQLHSVPFQIMHGIELPDRQNPMMFPLFKDLDLVLQKVTGPIAAALAQYVQVNTSFLEKLGPEIVFYLGAVRLIQRLRAAGLPVCRPEIAPAEKRMCELEDFYNLELALNLLDPDPYKEQDLSQEIVLNDVAFGSQGRIFILTGPNRGGKTTYTQGIGVAQILCQAGLYVPARKARISPVDGIFTHFPLEEKPDLNVGRLGEEAQRLNAIFQRITRHSLVLFNETLSATSPGESLYLARDLMQVLRKLGVRTVYATHLHELAKTDVINDLPGDSLAISLVAGAVLGNGTSDEVKRTYKIIPSPATGFSYAKDIARRHGISSEQLIDVLQQRRCLLDADSSPSSVTQR